MERGAPSLNAFLASLEVQDDSDGGISASMFHLDCVEETRLVDATLLRQFLAQVSYRSGLRAKA